MVIKIFKISPLPTQKSSIFAGYHKRQYGRKLNLENKSNNIKLWATLSQWERKHSAFSFHLFQAFPPPSIFDVFCTASELLQVTPVLCHTETAAQLSVETYCSAECYSGFPHCCRQSYRYLNNSLLIIVNSSGGGLLAVSMWVVKEQLGKRGECVCRKQGAWKSEISLMFSIWIARLAWNLH